MTTPGSIEFILDIVKEMASVLQDPEKRIFVHCHSGLNRSALLIACYIIYESSNDKTLDTIIEEIRKARQGSLQKEKYVKFCGMFKECTVLYLI